MNLIRKVILTIEKYKLLNPNDKIVLAVSGGYDSTAMLLIFSILKNEFNFELIVAHLNHSIRGIDADKDEFFVKKLAEKYNLRFVSEKINVPVLRKMEKKKSLEQIERGETMSIDEAFELAMKSYRD